MTTADGSGRIRMVTPNEGAGPTQMVDVLDHFLIAVNDYALYPVTRGLVEKWYRVKADAEQGELAPELARMEKEFRVTGRVDTTMLTRFGVPVTAPRYLAKALWPAAPKRRAYLMADGLLSQLAAHLDEEIGHRKAAPLRTMAAFGAIQFVCDQNHAEYEKIVSEYEASTPAGTMAEKARRRRDVLRLHFEEVRERFEAWAETNAPPAGIDPYDATYWAGHARLGRGPIPVDGVLQDFDGMQREHDALRQKAERYRKESEACGHYGGRPPLPAVIEPHRQGLEQALILVSGIMERRPGASSEAVISEARAEAQREGRRPPSSNHLRMALINIKRERERRHI